MKAFGRGWCARDPAQSWPRAAQYLEQQSSRRNRWGDECGPWKQFRCWLEWNRSRAGPQQKRGEHPDSWRSSSSRRSAINESGLGNRFRVLQGRMYPKSAQVKILYLQPTHKTPKSQPGIWISKQPRDFGTHRSAGCNAQLAHAARGRKCKPGFSGT